MSELVAVRLLTCVTDAHGGQWNPGEVAGFPHDVAEDLIARGAARPPDKKAPAGPPADKMVRPGGTVKKAP